MRTNTAPVREPVLTHGGSAAYAHLTPLQQLERTVLSCMLWEDEFYEEGGKSIADRILELAPLVGPVGVSMLAIKARREHNLRHVPLLLLVALLRLQNGAYPFNTDKAEVINMTLRRADEMAELLSLYWKINGVNAPLASALKKGLAKAFRRFDAYQLAKYDRASSVRLRDVLFLCHAKPSDEAQAALWKQLIDGTLPAPDTWERAPLDRCG